MDIQQPISPPVHKFTCSEMHKTYDLYRPTSITYNLYRPTLTHLVTSSHFICTHDCYILSVHFKYDGVERQREGVEGDGESGGNEAEGERGGMVGRWGGEMVREGRRC